MREKEANLLTHIIPLQHFFRNGKCDSAERNRFGCRSKCRREAQGRTRKSPCNFNGTKSVLALLCVCVCASVCMEVRVVSVYTINLHLCMCVCVGWAYLALLKIADLVLNDDQNLADRRTIIHRWLGIFGIGRRNCGCRCCWCGGGGGGHTRRHSSRRLLLFRFCTNRRRHPSLATTETRISVFLECLQLQSAQTTALLRCGWVGFFLPCRSAARREFRGRILVQHSGVLKLAALMFASLHSTVGDVYCVTKYLASVFVKCKLHLFCTALPGEFLDKYFFSILKQQCTSFIFLI